MAKYGIQKGDKIRARYNHTREENGPTIVHEGGDIGKELTVTKVWSHGVRTREHGYIHNNRILSKAE